MFSIIVPAFNEGEHIFDDLKKIAEAVERFTDDYEVIAVNDGSRDDTGAEIARAARENTHIVDAGYEVNRGKGGAIKQGISVCRGDQVGFIDADLDIPANLIEPYYKAMLEENADIVIGSKMHRDSRLEYPPARKFVSFCYYIMLKVLFGLNCHDTQTGLKIYRGDLIRRVAPVQRIKGYAFDIEMIALSCSDGAKLIEMPVELNFTRGESFGRIKFRDVLKMFTDTFKIWWNLRVRKSYSI